VALNELSLRCKACGYETTKSKIRNYVHIKDNIFMNGLLRTSHNALFISKSQFSISNGRWCHVTTIGQEPTL